MIAIATIALFLSALLQVTQQQSSTGGPIFQFSTDSPPAPRLISTITVNNVAQRFQSPNYPGQYVDNLNVMWVLRDTNNRGVRLTFNQFGTESCCDHVIVYDGSAADPSKELWRKSGMMSAQERVVDFTRSTITVVFRSDGSIQGVGFSVDAISLANVSPIPTIATTRGASVPPSNGPTVRGGSVPPFSQPPTGGASVPPSTRGGSVPPFNPTTRGSQPPFNFSGTPMSWTWTPPSNESVFRGSFVAPAIISSPNYPSSYNNDVNVYWVVSTPETNNSLRIRFQAFEMESCCDHVIIYRESGINPNNEITRMSGNYNNYEFFTNARTITIQFRTDGSVVARGFSVTVESTNSSETVQTNGYPWWYTPEPATGNPWYTQGQYTHYPNNNYTDYPGMRSSDRPVVYQHVAQRCSLYPTAETSQYYIQLGCTSWNEVCVPDQISCATNGRCARPWGWCLPVQNQ